MITCDACGASNEAGAQFCGSCGEFLWDRSAREEPATAPVRSTTTSATATPTKASPAEREQGGDERHIEAVQPGASKPLPAAPRPEPVPDTDGPAPAPPDARVVCPNPACGMDNDRSRKFCRRCGHSLVAAMVVAAPKRRWWQRLWDRLRAPRRRRSLRDEERRVSGAARRIVLLVLAVCLLAVLAVVGPPLARRGLEAVRDRTQDPTPLVPTSMAASSETLGAGAGRLIDGANNKYWAPAGKATDSWVEGRFNEPVRLLTVVITPGVSPRRQAYLAAGRPRELTVVTVNADGEEQSTDIELVDEPGPQHFDVPTPDLVRVRLVVRSTYGPGLIPAVAIGEAEFFGRR